MNPAYVYLQLYRLFDDHTPIAADCGALCDKACCRGDDAGMYLFPGEEKVYELLKPKWAKVSSSDLYFEYGGKKKNVSILFCNGECDRYQRPMACRIFPLTPYVNDRGKIEIISDPRARALCPLVYELEAEQFDKTFYKNVKRAFSILEKNKEVCEFLKVYSDYLGDYLKFFKKR